jgi:hypothetical protein
MLGIFRFMNIIITNTPIDISTLPPRSLVLPRPLITSRMSSTRRRGTRSIRSTVIVDDVGVTDSPTIVESRHAATAIDGEVFNCRCRDTSLRNVHRSCRSVVAAERGSAALGRLMVWHRRACCAVRVESNIAADVLVLGWGWRRGIC